MLRSPDNFRFYQTDNFYKLLPHFFCYSSRYSQPYCGNQVLNVVDANIVIASIQLKCNECRIKTRSSIILLSLSNNLIYFHTQNYDYE